MRFSSLAVIGLGLLLSACSQKPVVTKASLDGYGIYAGKVVDRMPSAESSSGVVSVSESWKLLKSTDVIEAEPGVAFGITYTPVGRPAGARIETVVRISHPPIHNPELGKVFAYDDDPHEDAIGRQNYSGFTFEKDWEMVPGKWTFQVYRGSELLLEKSFEVVRTGAGK